MANGTFQVGPSSVGRRVGLMGAQVRMVHNHEWCSGMHEYEWCSGRSVGAVGARWALEVGAVGARWAQWALEVGAVGARWALEVLERHVLHGSAAITELWR